MGKGEIMDEDDYMNWLNYREQDLREAFIEKMQEEFDEYCYERYIGEEPYDPDEEYDRQKDDQII